MLKCYASWEVAELIYFSHMVVYKSWSGEKWISRLKIIKKYWQKESDIEDKKGSYIIIWYPLSIKESEGRQGQWSWE